MVGGRARGAHVIITGGGATPANLANTLEANHCNTQEANHTNTQ